MKLVEQHNIQFENQFRYQISNQLGNKIYNRIGNKLDTQFADQLGHCLLSHLEDQIRWQIKSELG